MAPIQSTPIDLTRDTSTIQNTFVGNGSASNYISRLVTIITWLFDKEEYHIYLDNNILQTMQTAHRSDNRGRLGIPVLLALLVPLAHLDASWSVKFLSLGREQRFLPSSFLLMNIQASQKCIYLCYLYLCVEKMHICPCDVKYDVIISNL